MTGHGAARCLVHGSICIDEIYQVKEIVRPGQTISSTQFERRPGGKGANQAVAIAKAYPTQGKVDLDCCVGEDGRWIIHQLEEMGVYAGGVVVVKEPTGRAIIQVAEGGENSIVLFRGANFATRPNSPTEIFSLGITHLLLQNEIPLSSTLEFLAAAPPNVSTIFNPSPIPSPDEIIAFPWIKLSWLVVNESEADALLAVFDAPPTSTTPSSLLSSALSLSSSASSSATTTTSPPSTETTATTTATTTAKPKFTASFAVWPRAPPVALVKASRGTEASTPPEPGNPSLAMPALWPDPAPPTLRAAYATALRLARHPSFSPTTNLICTLGPAGVIAVIPSLMHPIYMPAPSTEACDTTGAGDCFTGYFVAGLMERYERGAPMGEAEMTEMLRRCVQAASMCVEKRGAMDSFPSAQEVDSRLA